MAGSFRKKAAMRCIIFLIIGLLLKVLPFSVNFSGGGSFPDGPMPLNPSNVPQQDI